MSVRISAVVRSTRVASRQRFFIGRSPDRTQNAFTSSSTRNTILPERVFRKSNRPVIAIAVSLAQAGIAAREPGPGLRYSSRPDVRDDARVLAHAATLWPRVNVASGRLRWTHVGDGPCASGRRVTSGRSLTHTLPQSNCVRYRSFNPGLATVGSSQTGVFLQAGSMRTQK